MDGKTTFTGVSFCARRHWLTFVVLVLEIRALSMVFFHIGARHGQGMAWHGEWDGMGWV